MTAFLAMLIPFVALFQAVDAGPVKAPPMSAKLYAAKDAITPGEKLDLAVEITIGDKWHSYYPIYLGAGGPTTLRFNLPDAKADKSPVALGPVRFPVPTFDEQNGMEFLGFEGGTTVLTDITLDPAAAASLGSTLKLEVTVEGIICHAQKGCVPAEIHAKLELPISRTSGKLANNAIFDAAFAAQMKPLAKSEYIAGSSITLTKPRIAIGEENELVATIKVKPGHHIQAPDPGIEGLIGTRLLVERLSGIKFEEPIFPEPKKHKVEGLGIANELSGEFKIRIPFKVIDSQFARGPVNLRAAIYYQCCVDNGVCFPPEFADAVFSFEVDAPTMPNKGPLWPGHGTYYPAVTLGAKSVAGSMPPTPTAAQASPSAAPAITAPAPTTAAALINYLLLGFLGGLILNIMPCVLPVISIKILSFVQQAGDDPTRVWKLGLTFCAGIMAWFWVFAFLSSRQLVALQEPAVVLAISAILFLMALNLFGVFEITLPGAAAGAIDSAASHEGYFGSFFKGFLATLLGTACTAPALVSALAFAATQPWYVGYIVFSSAGVGMAAPYLLLSANPRWLKFVPRPGKWMLTFKEATGFVVLGTVVWLLLPLEKQIGGRGIVWTLSFFAFLGLAGWIYGKISPAWSFNRRWGTTLIVAATGLFGWWFSLRLMFDFANPPTESAAIVKVEGGKFADAELDALVARVRAANWESGIPWQKYQQGLAAALSAKGYTVYVDYTADWCATCKANTAAALEVESTRRKMSAMGVIPIEADYTGKNPRISEDLRAFGYAGVPMNLMYPANRPNDIIKLPTVLLPSTVHAAIDQAGPSADARETAAK